jgi:hypothetical protein
LLVDAFLERSAREAPGKVAIVFGDRRLGVSRAIEIVTTLPVTTTGEAARQPLIACQASA